jgi:hypothetical protein
MDFNFPFAEVSRNGLCAAWVYYLFSTKHYFNSPIFAQRYFSASILLL